MKNLDKDFIVKLGMLAITLLSLVLTYQAHQLNSRLATKQIEDFERQNKLSKKQFESFELQKQLAQKQIEAFERDKLLTHEQINSMKIEKKLVKKQLDFINEELSPDIYFFVKPKIREKSRQGNIYHVDKKHFLQKSSVEFSINNRGKKGVNIFGIIANGRCLNLEENHTLEVVPINGEAINPNKQKKYESSILENVFLESKNCKIEFTLFTSFGNYKTHMIIE